jgi:lysophospholipase
VLVSPGWTENTHKYREVAGDLVERGYSVFVLDHRSQGESSRLTANPQVTHVGRFEDYVSDLAAFYRRIVLARAHGDVALLGHSLGGLIATHFAASRPERLNALVLSAPLFEVHGGLLPEHLMYCVATVLAWLGRGESYVPGHRDFDEGSMVFEGNPLTHSEERFGRWRTILLDAPELQVGGVSNHWLKSVIAATRSVVALAGRLRVPVLLLQAGLDRLARPGRQEQFCRRCESCVLERFPAARHELLTETDPIRNRVLATILDFLRRVGKRHSGAGSVTPASRERPG